MGLAVASRGSPAFQEVHLFRVQSPDHLLIFQTPFSLGFSMSSSATRSCILSLPLTLHDSASLMSLPSLYAHPLWPLPFAEPKPAMQCSAPAHLSIKLPLTLPTFSAVSFPEPPVSSAPFILLLTHALASFPHCLGCAFFLVGGWLLRAENTCFPFLKLLSPQHRAVPQPGVQGDAVFKIHCEHCP